MAINNKPPAVDIPLDAFLGLVTESDITSLPAGSSPDNQDITFVPGGFDSRPGLHKLFAAAMTDNPTYQKTFVQDNGQPLNLYLDAAGIFWQEDVTNSPGVKTQVHQGPPGLFAQSVSAFGREWIAFSDGRHGADVPRQYDGTFFDRVTQDGPAGLLTAADLNSSIVITSITGAAAVNIARISQNGLVNTIITATPHLLNVGDGVNIAVAAANPFNGSYFVTGTPSPTEFTVAAQTAPIAAAFALGSIQNNLVTVVTAAPHGLQLAGDVVAISGSANNNYNNGNVSTDAVGGTVQNQGTWNVSSITNATTFLMAVNVGFPGAVLGGNAQIGGLISPGVHQVCVCFLTRLGYLTKPSRPTSWVCGGQKQVVITNLPIGPPNVVARVLIFTGAGGAFFFTIGATVPAGAIATIVPDNTSTTCTMDFSDNSLFAAEAVDIEGNNLFAQRVVGPCLGFTFYASRLAAWGEYRRIENLLNMGFEGGVLAGAPNAPLGWTVGANPGVLDAGAANFGLAWKITGDGTANARGVLTQSIYQDYLNIAIAPPGEPLTFRCWAKASAAGLNGNIQAIISSASTGFTSTASIPINTCTTIGGFVQANFSLPLPAVIPADMILTIQEKSLNNLATIELDELEIIFTAQPFLDNIAYFSYIENPEAFDSVTGKVQPTDDDSAIRFFATLRRWLVMATAQGLHRMIDGPGEPSTWDIDPITGAVGALSFRAGDPGKFGKGDTGEEWLVIGSYAGVYLYGGGPLWKVSQENQPIWDRINKAAEHTLWIKNDPATRRIYLGLPLDQATAPNTIYPLDYRELDTDQQIASSPPIRTGYSGKDYATDRSRKWTKWSIASNCGEILARPNNVYEFCLGAGNGVTPGQIVGFGNVYFLDPAKLTDDDYGPIVPFWFSHLFPTHEEEKQYQIGSYRKDFVYSAYYATGVGQLVVTPYAGSLANPRQASVPRTLNLTQNNDIEIPLNVSASRVAFKISVIPLQGQTDVQLSVSKMIVSVRKSTMAVVRGAR